MGPLKGISNHTSAGKFLQQKIVVDTIKSLGNIEETDMDEAPFVQGLFPVLQQI